MIVSPYLRDQQQHRGSLLNHFTVVFLEAKKPARAAIPAVLFAKKDLIKPAWLIDVAES
jgi:hypothetical protein